MKKLNEIKTKHDMHYYYDQIDKNIEISFNHEQSKAVKNIILRCIDEKYHSGISFTVYFWLFKSFFFFVQIASSKQSFFIKKSAGTAYFIFYFIKNLICFTISILILIFFIFSILYTFKSLLGWDIISGVHVQELIQEMLNNCY